MKKILFYTFNKYEKTMSETTANSHLELLKTKG